MTHLKPIAFVLFIIIAGCSSKPVTHSTKSSKTNVSTTRKSVSIAKNEISFKQFISKFKPLRLPLGLNPDSLQVHDSLSAISGTNAPYLNIDRDKLGSNYAYGILPDTLDSYKLIWLYPAEIYIPVLTTFSKSGKKLSEEHLTVGRCGSDCCYSCQEQIKIGRDLTILSIDSISSCECDSTGPIKSTMTKYVVFKEGKITPAGKIVLSKEKIKTLDR